MSLRRFVARCRGIFQRETIARDLDREIRSHVDLAAEDYIESGKPPRDAQAMARRSFDHATLSREDSRAAWGFPALESLWQDLRFGIRMLRTSPGFTAVATLTLALGIGANTAIFSIVDAVLLRPLPFPEPSRLVALAETKPTQNLAFLPATPISYNEWDRRQNVFQTFAASSGCLFRLAAEGTPHLLPGRCTTSGLLPMLGVKPELGSLWGPQNDDPNSGKVALISDTLWRTEFGGTPDVLGKTIWRATDRAVFTIIGVLPPDFQFATEDTEVWAPLALNMNAPSVRFHSLTVFARLKPEVSISDAQSSMSAIARQLESIYPVTNTGWGVTVRPLQEYYADTNNTRTPLLVLLAAVGFVLLIACANVANLLRARATVRQRELAVRVAMGASRARLLRQLVTESLLLGGLGGAAGFFAAFASFRSMLNFAPSFASFEQNSIRMDGRVFAFSVCAALFSSVLFGLLPALRVSKTDPDRLLREAGRSGQGSLRDRLTRESLVVVEISFAMILVMGTGLLVETLRNLRNDPLGYRSDHLLAMGFCCLDSTHYPDQPKLSSFYRQLHEKVSALPGVESVTTNSVLPLRDFDGAGSVYRIQSRPLPAPGKELVSDFRTVFPNFFEAMGIPIQRGRALNLQDDEQHEPVAVINATLARRMWPDRDPIGDHIQFPNVIPPRWFTIVGVSGDFRDRGLGREIRSTIYLSLLQNRLPGMRLLVRTKTPPYSMGPAVHDAIRALNSDISIDNPTTLDDLLFTSLAPERFSATLLTIFAALALVLASIGIYGVTSYGVAQRSHEIGIRLAMGARPGNVLSMILKQGIALALAGVAIGVFGALALTRLIAAMLFGVTAHDPLTILGVGGILTAVTLLACFIPALRAMRLDPIVILRHD